MTIIDFRKIGQKGLKNEDKVVPKFEKEDKVRQKSLKKEYSLNLNQSKSTDYQ